MKKIQRVAKPISWVMAVMMFLIFAPVHTAVAALIATDDIASSQAGQAARSW